MLAANNTLIGLFMGDNFDPVLRQPACQHDVQCRVCHTVLTQPRECGWLKSCCYPQNEGDGLKLYSSLQTTDEGNNIDGSSDKQKPAKVRRRPPPASFLKSGDRIRRRRPVVKSLVSSGQPPTPSGGLVKNDDVLYRESLYKDTPGDDAWDDAVSKVKQDTSSSPAYLSQSASAPVFVSQKRNRIRKRPRKKNSVRRRRSSRTTAAHFNGLPDATGSDGVWEAAEWMEGLGLTSRYKTGGDHVTVTEPGIYLVYAQVKLALTNRAAGFDIKVNNRSAASCAHISDSYTSTCYTSSVAYLPKNSVVRVESHTPESPILRLQDGEEASLGLIKLLDAPASYHQLFSA
ncbi:tumor necrosis factor-like domain [Trinorchestia longiramus]|nr:tumor necrosis factor-like domain [Trinorchestia longiramus]